MSKTIEELLSNSEGVILTVIDHLGFPNNQLFSRPVYRNHYYSMIFYIEENKTIMECIQKNGRAALCFFDTLTLEAVFINGMVSIQDKPLIEEVEQYCAKYRSLERIKKPMRIDFQTLAIQTGRIESLI